jgi:hypothetical protein
VHRTAPQHHRTFRVLQRPSSHLPAEVLVELGLVIDDVDVPRAVPELHVQVREVGRYTLSQPLRSHPTEVLRRSA